MVGLLSDVPEAGAFRGSSAGSRAVGWCAVLGGSTVPPVSTLPRGPTVPRGSTLPRGSTVPRLIVSSAAMRLDAAPRTLTVD